MPAAKSKYRYPRARQQTRPVVVHPQYALAVTIGLLAVLLSATVMLVLLIGGIKLLFF